MKRTLLLCTVLLFLILGGCNNEEPMQKIGSPLPYGIIEDVRWFTIDTSFPDMSWKTATENWEQEQHDGFLPDCAIEPPYRGCWTIFLDGPVCSLTQNKEHYEKICLDWGVRIDNGEVESDVLANIPRHCPNGILIGGYIVTNHGITGMDLITESDFDAEHPAGSSLADITDVRDPSLEYAFKGEPWTIEIQNARIRMCDVNASTFQRIDLGIDTQITRNPQQAGEYVFRQIIYFADGKVVQRRFKRIWLEEHLNLEYNEPHKPL